MDVIKRETIFNQTQAWILEAGAEIRKKMNNPLTIKTKSNPNDLVTEVDKDIERFFVERIKRKYPDHLLITEEGFGDELKDLRGTVWIIDPIDGTMNFIHRKRDFCISIGIYDDGIGEIGFVYDVMANNLYCALRDGGAFKNDEQLEPLNRSLSLSESILCLNHHWLCENTLVDHEIMQKLVRDVRGTRTYGSAALEFAFVAEGVVDGYISMRLEPWDLAAGAIIVNEVGGKTTQVDGEDINMLKRNPVFTGNPKIHPYVIDNYLNKAKK